MMRLRPITNLKAVLAYHSKSDGGYLLGGEDLGMRWDGKGAGQLGLEGKPTYEEFERLLKGLDPHSGDQLTAKLRDDRVAGWEATLCLPKGVTIAHLRGDERVRHAQWEAVHEAIADLEAHIMTRIRKGGQHDERLTGNLVALIAPHPETRPTREDGMSDPDDHFHVIIFNLTHDPIEHEWKAIKFRPIMDLRKWFDRRFDMRLASKLADLGYNVETKHRSDGKGGRRYYSWDIKDMPASVVAKFSRRTQEVEKLADQLGIDNPTSKDKLGATSRQMKRDDMTLADYRAYWDSRLTEEEKQKVAEVIDRARNGLNPAQSNTVDKGVAYAIEHEFERRSVVRKTDLEITAMERSMGGAIPEEIEPEMRKQGVLLRDGEATTRNVLAEEQRVIAFARDGRGTCRPMGVQGVTESNLTVAIMQPWSHSGNRTPTSARGHGSTDTATLPGFGQEKGRPDESRRPLATAESRNPISDTATSLTDLSTDQLRIARHVWDSTDRVILIRGAAGTGKTHTMKATIAGIDRPVVVLAPSAEASRGVLRKEGFDDADTVARFLQDEEFQQQAKNGVIWVDEAGLLGIRQTRQVFDLADKLGARVVLQGDNKQHGSVERGATLRVLQDFAGLPVAELTDIRRQRGDYKKAVASLAKGDILAGYDKLAGLGWVHEAQDNKPLVDDYMAALGAGKSVLVVAPTHVEGNEITAEIRDRLRQGGKLGDEIMVEQLVPLGWTDAEKGDLERYEGTETIKYHRNTGSFRAGQSVRISDWRPGQRLGDPRHYSVYARGSIGLARGDVIRITGNGWDTVYVRGVRERGKHKLNNGAQYTVAGFTKEGDIALTNGWVVAKDYGMLAHGYVATSHASQGKTVDRVLIAMGRESVPAMSAEQFYVSVSRGRDRATIYSDLKQEQLREAIQRQDPRKSATELMKPRRKKRKLRAFVEKARGFYRQLRERVEAAMREPIRERELVHAR